MWASIQCCKDDRLSNSIILHHTSEKLIIHNGLRMHFSVELLMDVEDDRQTSFSTANILFLRVFIIKFSFKQIHENLLRLLFISHRRSICNGILLAYISFDENSCMNILK